MFICQIHQMSRQRTNKQIILVCVYVCVCKMFAGAGDSAFFHKDPQVCLSVSLSVCLPVCLCVESILSIQSLQLECQRDPVLLSLVTRVAE